jgi:hypothetical protein
MIKKFSIFTILFALVFSEASSLAASSDVFKIECRKSIHAEIDRMAGEYLKWFEKISEQRNLVSEDVVPLIFGKADLEKETLGMLTELRMDLDLYCTNLKGDYVFQDACNWEKYDNVNNPIASEDVLSVWIHCEEMVAGVMRDLEDFTEMELRRDAYEEKVHFVLKKYRHILENLKVLNDEFGQIKYYVTSIAERVKCLAQNCIK